MYDIWKREIVTHNQIQKHNYMNGESEELQRTILQYKHEGR